MRTREEIMADTVFNGPIPSLVETRLQLEVLLDIRDLLYTPMDIEV